MEPPRDTLAENLWELVHVVRLPIRKAAARLKLSVTAAYELLAREKLRRESLVLKLPVKVPLITRKLANKTRRGEDVAERWSADGLVAEELHGAEDDARKKPPGFQ
jgi:hypothetical protein